MTIDSSSELLIQHLKQSYLIRGKRLRILLVADENTHNDLDFSNIFSKEHSLDILTNRYEIYQSMLTKTSRSVSVYFSDFDFSQLKEKYDIFAYRISKEKTVVHHILNNFLYRSSSDTRILLSGEKSDGIKTYTKNMLKQDMINGTVKKTGSNYLSELTMKHPPPSNETFDTQNYTVVRLIKTVSLNQNTYEIHSKPGTYGWQKIDKGSELLCENFIQQEMSQNHRDSHLLDLGCGSGLLSLAGHSLGINNIIATDNNAAALVSTQASFDKNNIIGTVIADNCAGQISKPFDLLLCNPPFHKGFNTSNVLTEQFVKAARKLLKPSGRAYFVTNSFIGIEKIAERYFQTVETLENNKHFKVLRFS